MTKLEETVHAVQEQQRALLSDATFRARNCYFQQLLKISSTMNITEPCQELYDAFVADDYGSKDRRFYLFHCIKLVDLYAGTKALREDGTLYNEPPLPTVEETYRKMEDICYPAESPDIGFLITKSGQVMEYLNLTASTTGQYIHAWRDVYRYFYLQGSTVYSREVIQNYIAQITSMLNLGRMNMWKWKINRRAAHVLMEVADTGHFQWAHVYRKPCCSNPAMESVRKKYLTSLAERNLSQSTVSLHDYVLRKALDYSGFTSTAELYACTSTHVQNIIKRFSIICTQRSISTVFPIFRSILDFCYSNSLMQKQLSGMIMSAFVQKGNVAAYISLDDEERLLCQLGNESRRTRAVILLALRLGLRDSDICNLRFSEIDWREDKVRINQKKTGYPLVLPLLPDVGNALMDYIINDRPSRKDSYPYVFLRKQAPFNKLTSVYQICARLIQNSGIVPVNGTSTGVHLYRYTLVHRLLDAKVPHQVITDTLGHVSKESDKPYISMEGSMLRVCALDLSVIGIKSWKEGGHNE